MKAVLHLILILSCHFLILVFFLRLIYIILSYSSIKDKNKKNQIKHFNILITLDTISQKR
jgi:hypothetical protein